jgi:alpha-tubulin suppressor-like RCC1 family protein
VWGWGKNSKGELCDGTTEPRTTPVQAKGIANAVDIDLDDTSVIVLADGTVRTCGEKRASPFQVPGLTGVRSAHTGGGATIAHLADGTLRAWGLGWYGALGDGHGDQSSATPKAPIGLGPVVAHYMTSNTSYAIRADGTVLAWGGLLAPPGSKTQFILTPSPVFTVKLGQ